MQKGSIFRDVHYHGLLCNKEVDDRVALGLIKLKEKCNVLAMKILILGKNLDAFLLNKLLKSLIKFIVNVRWARSSS